MKTTLLKLTANGLYCPQGQFFIDPWRAAGVEHGETRTVARAIITHGHSDHATWGCENYLAARDGERVLKTRLGENISLTTLEYGEKVVHNGVTVSLHPAGHILGSAQVRVEFQGEVAVVSGDYKLAADPTCRSFEPVRCHHFVTESTFGLPIYNWHDTSRIMTDISDWWRTNRDLGKASIIYAYSLGKAQRILAQVDSTIGPIVVHGAIETMNRAYRDSGVALPTTHIVSTFPGKNYSGALVVAPPSAQQSPWVRRFEPSSEAVASGWMAVRGIRRRRVVDRGFILSDHADWPGLNEAVVATGATSVSVTHGSTEVFSRWLRAKGIEADVIATRFEGEAAAATDDAKAVEA